MRVTAPSPSNCFIRAVINGRDRLSSRAQWRSATVTVSVPSASSATLVTPAMARPTAALQASATLPGDSGWSRNSISSAAVVQRPAAVIDRPSLPVGSFRRISFTVM